MLIFLVQGVSSKTFGPDHFQHWASLFRGVPCLSDVNLRLLETQQLYSHAETLRLEPEISQSPLDFRIIHIQVTGEFSLLGRIEVSNSFGHI